MNDSRDMAYTTAILSPIGIYGAGFNNTRMDGHVYS